MATHLDIKQSRLPNGKYQAWYILDVCTRDPGYMKWLIEEGPIKKGVKSWGDIASYLRSQGFISEYGNYQQHPVPPQDNDQDKINWDLLSRELARDCVAIRTYWKIYTSSIPQLGKRWKNIYWQETMSALKENLAALQGDMDRLREVTLQLQKDNIHIRSSGV